MIKTLKLTITMPAKYREEIKNIADTARIVYANIRETRISIEEV